MRNDYEAPTMTYAGVKCEGKDCAALANWRVFWPGKELCMCEYHKQAAETIAREGMGFELAFVALDDKDERERLVKALVLELEATSGGVVLHGTRAAQSLGTESSPTFHCFDDWPGHSPSLILITPHIAVAAKFLAGWLE